MSASYGNYLTEEDPNKKKLSEGTTPSTTPTTVTGGTTTPPLTYEGFVGTGSGSQAYQTNVGYVNNQYNASVNAANTNKETGTQYAQAQKDSIYGAANTNKELGMSYAEGVKNSIYGNAAAQRAEADKNTEAARQRGIIDSQSSYQKAVGAYGSNAETLAGRGLSGSGYGEYLTADAYATHRGQVQNINADALRANREAAYAENQAKMAADSEYLKNLYGINTEYNNAVSGADSEYLKNLYGINTEYNAAMNKAESDRTTGMYQAALGLNEAQNTAYGKLFDSASKGVSIDAITQDGTWGDLTPEQQQAITAEAERYANKQSKAEGSENDATYLGLLGDINSGTLTIDAIKNTAMWGALSGPQQLQLEAAAALKGKAEMKDRMGVYADLATKGVSLEDIKTMMEINGDKYVEELTEEKYNELTDEQKAEYNEARNFMKLIESSVKTYAAAQKKLESEDRPNQIAGLADVAAKGYSIDEIKQWAEIYGITDLSENELAVIQSSADRYAAAQEKLKSEEMTDRYFGYSELANAGYSIDDIKAMMSIYGDEYISAEEYEKLDDEGKKAKAEARKYSALIDTALGRYSSAQEKLESENEMERALGYVGLLEAGWTLDDVKALIGTEAWNAMGTEARNMIKKSSEVIGNLKTEAANKDAKGALEAYIKAAGEGLSIDALTAIAMANGHYDVLVGEKGTEEGKTLWDAVVAEAEKLTNQNATNDTLTNIENAIKDGATLEDIQKMPGYDELDDLDKSNIEQAVTDRDEKKEVTIDSVVANLFVPGNEVYSLDDLDTVMRAEGVPSEMREEVISRWQSENVSRALSGIKDGSFFDNTSAADLVENIKNGVYGNRGDDVAAEYSKVLQASIQEADCDIVDFALASDSFDQIKEYLPTNITNRWESEKGNRLKIDPKFAMTNDSKIGSTPVKKGEKITDEATVAALNRYKTDSKTQLITIGNNKYYRDGDSWSLVVEDMSKPIALTAYHLFNDVSGTGTVATQGTGYAIEGKKIGFATIDKASKTALKNKYPAPTEMMYVKVGTRYYVYMGNDWKYAYITE